MLARELVRPIARTLAALGLASATAGALMYAFTHWGPYRFTMPGPFFDRIPEEKHGAFVTCAASHVAAYYVGAALGLVLAINVYRRRARVTEPPGALGTSANALPESSNRMGAD